MKNPKLIGLWQIYQEPIFFTMKNPPNHVENLPQTNFFIIKTPKLVYLWQVYTQLFSIKLD